MTRYDMAQWVILAVDVLFKLGVLFFLHMIVQALTYNANIQYFRSTDCVACFAGKGPHSQKCPIWQSSKWDK